jgi:hypothetical protein
MLSEYFRTTQLRAGEATGFANGLALGAFAAKADRSSFGKINILREETFDLPKIQRVLLACVSGRQKNTKLREQFCRQLNFRAGKIVPGAAITNF